MANFNIAYNITTCINNDGTKAQGRFSGNKFCMISLIASFGGCVAGATIGAMQRVDGNTIKKILKLLSLKN